MKPLHENQRHNLALQQRSGLSIIEVLTSIVVAMIGVFGVMILIPFAVKQAQTGLDSDAATMLGRNANAQFEIAGYRFPENWAVYNTALGKEIPYSPFRNWDSDGDGVRDSSPMAPRIISIDPLGIAENGMSKTTPLATGAAHSAAFFPYNRLDIGTPFPADLNILPANLGTASGATMADSDLDGLVDLGGQALARRMFRTSEDLIFGDAADELLGPEQAFDLGPSGVLRRQSNGRLSWSAIVVPFKDNPLLGGTNRWSYKMYILVYKDRGTSIDAAPEPEDQMATAQVTNTGSVNPVSTVFLETGGSPILVQGFVARDDWVMLINRNSAAEPGFDRQLAFYRVVNVSDESAVAPANMTLDGPPFVFSDGSGNYGPTYVVHLQDVVSVFERTFTPESESNWNITY